MSAESRLEKYQSSRWSVLNGQFIPELAIYEGRVKSIADRHLVEEQWKDDKYAPRVLIADIVQDAVQISQPELFTDDNVKEVVEKDIGTSVYACYSYDEGELSVVEEKVREVIDTGAKKVAVLETLESLLKDSEIALPSGQDLRRVCRVSVYHVLLKQKGKSGELPRASYN